VVAGSGTGIDCAGGSHCLFTVRKFFKNAICVKDYIVLTLSEKQKIVWFLLQP
jgi:hypothetical protein